MNETQFKKLPLAQRKAIQEQLKSQNLYAGAIDGEWGAGTETAFRLREEAEARAAQQERAGRIAETQAAADAEKAKAEADRIRAEAEAERLRSAQSQQYSEQANSPKGIGTRIAANTAAPLTGVALGRSMGSGINALADRSQESRNRALQGAAQDRMEGRTTREGARVGTERSGAMPSRNSFLRVTGRMLPHAISGAAMLGKGGLMLADEGGEAFYADQANRAAGLGMIGTGAGLLERGAAYAVNPGVSPDARAIAIMESNQLRRGAAQASQPKTIEGEVVKTPPRAPAPGSLAALRDQAKQLGVSGRSKMNKAQLADAVAEKLKAEGGKRTIGQRVKSLPKSGVLGPLTAASLAYAMTPEEAQAADGTPGSSNTAKALTNAGVAGGTAYGIQRALPEMTGRALSGFTPAMAPEMVSGMTDEFASPEARNMAARNLPEFMRAGGVEDAYQMAQVPERNPARVYGNAYQPGGAQQAPQTAQGLVSQPSAPAQASQPQAAFMRALEDIYAVLQGQGPEQAAGPYTP